MNNPFLKLFVIVVVMVFAILFLIPLIENKMLHDVVVFLLIAAGLYGAFKLIE